MKKSLLMAFALLFSIASINAQRVLLDFETESQAAGTCFGTGNPDNLDCHSEIANPDASGVNTSATVGTFIEPASGETWMGMYFDVINGGDVDLTTATGNTEICADVWVPAGSGGTFTLKVEKINADGTTVDAEYEPPAATPSAEGEWVTICTDYAAFNDNANRLVFFFNIGAVPAAETTYYFDNVVQPDPTSVGGLIEEKGLEIFPNPATYNLFFNADGEPMTVTVTDLAGREMIRHNSFTDNNIDVSDLNPGMYVITFVEESTGRFGSTKFSKQ